MERPLPPARALRAAAILVRDGSLDRIADSRALLILQSGLLLAMTATVATRFWQDNDWAGAALVGATAAVWAPEVRRRRMRAWWFVYVAGIFVYTLLRAIADETGIPIRTGYAISGDRFLFFGSEPVQWLQARFFSTTRISPLDIFAVQVHWSFFVAPHVAAVFIYLRHRAQFPRYTIAVVGTMYLGLLLFFLVPTTPPWLAGQQGGLSGVYRVMDFVGGRVNSGTYQSFYASLAEPNSVAAMPSIHMGVTFAMYLWAREARPRLAWVLLAYSGVMAFSLVYLAEHYVLDLLAGMALATVCHLAARRWLPAVAPAPG
ncbi:MAG: inositol phosphorylceramide synthase [Chloroflexi bacterium]|nr:inositol phosphorylceramide synthase [Chloroflexota bacterium]